MTEQSTTARLRDAMSEGSAVGFTPAMKARCAEQCAEYGEPPCWRLPDLVHPCDTIEPCDDCKAGKPVEPA